jgi:hypothetical protein
MQLIYKAGTIFCPCEGKDVRQALFTVLERVFLADNEKSETGFS